MRGIILIAPKTKIINISENLVFDGITEKGETFYKYSDYKKKDFLSGSPFCIWYRLGLFRIVSPLNED